VNAISQLYAQLPDQALPARQITELMKFAQSDPFFHLAVAKDLRIAELKAHFSKTGLSKVYLSANLSGFECDIEGIEISILEKGFFEEPDAGLRKAKQSRLINSIVIVNNNDAGSPEARAGYADFFGECTTTCFVAWDWDNHHWLELSTFLAAHSDIFAPAHHENLYLLSRYNWLVAGPVYCTSVQWSRQFLVDHLPEMLTAERSDLPLGMHIPYAPFSFRIQMITTLNHYYPSIGFSSHSFHARTLDDRLKEWYSHKTHWIAPVLNDVPIRIFDALVTGGIPIVPASLRFLPPVKDIPREHIAFYTPTDIVNPKALVEYANTLFNQGGRDGMVARHRLALQQHHGNASVKQMLNFAFEVLGTFRTCSDSCLKM
jgi:hypothetical protein